jgi:hypothetical protein
MASQDLNININAKDKASKQVKQITLTFTELNAKIQIAQTAMRTITGAITPLIDAAIRQDQAISRLNAQMQLNGEYTDTLSRGLQIFASRMQDTTRFGDELVLEMLTLAQAYGATAQQSKEIVLAGADFATQTGKSLPEAVRLLSKTLGGYAGELSDVFPLVKTLTQEQLRNGDAVDLLGSKYKGAAKEDARGYAGEIERLKMAYGDLQEDTGRLIGESDIFLKTVRYLRIEIQKLSEDVQNLSGDNGWEARLDSANRMLEMYASQLPLVGGLFQMVHDHNEVLRERNLTEEDYNLILEERASIEQMQGGGGDEERRKQQAAAMDQATKEARYIQQLEDLKRQEWENTQEKAAEIAGNMASIFRQESAAYKAFATVEAIISTYKAVNHALAEKLPHPMPEILAASRLAMGLANVAKIQGAKFHSGGLIGSASPGDVPIVAQSGEGIVSRIGMAAIGEQGLNNINRGGGMGGGVTVNIDTIMIMGQEAQDVDAIGESIGEQVLTRLRTAESF